jgi:precorrin-2 dehydrogenase/sirohydrochlorin ferrochelatase
MIPLIHDFTDERVLVLGGGPVGARKARRFATEAEVIVLSPEFADRSFGDAQLLRAAPDVEGVRSWIDSVNPALIVAATDDSELNDTAEQAAADRGILINRADDTGTRSFGSVVVPATVRDDPVVVAISTGGRSPALSKYLRQQFESEFAGAGEMAEVTGDLRAEFKNADMSPSERRKNVRAVVRSRDVWKALDSGKAKAKQVAADVIDQQSGDGS